MTLPYVKIYTDGACSPNPGPGGWGAVCLFQGKKTVELKGSEGDTTNNRMELTAALQALLSLKVSHQVELFTDSKYVQQGTSKWIKNWQTGNWLTKDRQEVKNRDLWEPLAELLEKHEISWHWVKGHAGNQWNERADELAVQARGKDTLPLNDQDCVHIFTAITWSQKDKMGSWVVLLRYRQHVKILGKPVRGVTGNGLHIISASNGLKALRRSIPVHIYTNSSYLRDGATKWLAGWQRGNWQTREGNPVSNRLPWQELSELLKKYSVHFHVVDKEHPPCYMQEVKEMARQLPEEEL